MSKVKRGFSREFKTAAVARILVGERIAAIAADLGVGCRLLYQWRSVFRAGGSQALRPRGRPPRKAQAARAPGLGVAAASCPAGQDAAAGELAAALARIAELERKIGRQHMELDFFRAALRQAGEPRQSNDASGATASTPSSKR